MRSVHIRTGRVSALALVSTMLVVLTVVLVANINTEVDGDGNSDLCITEQPSDQFIHDRTNAVFTIHAEGASSYQWEYSPVGNEAWANVTKGVGMTTGMLVISPSDYSDNEYMFRCVLTGADSTKMTSQSAYLYTSGTETPTADKVHYVSTVADLFKIGTEADWGLGDTYIQTADIDFTNPAEAALVESKVGKEKIKVSYSVKADNVTFTLTESDDGIIFTPIKKDTEVYYNFGLSDGMYKVEEGGKIVINDIDSRHENPLTVFSVGGVGEYGDFAISIEVNEEAVEKESYSLGNFIPIGHHSNDMKDAFTGLYDGRGYLIKGMETARFGVDKSYAGMFALSTGTIQNVCLEGGSSTSVGGKNSSLNVAAGGLVASGNGFIYNTYNTGIVGSNCHSGGLMGIKMGTTTVGEIRDCYNAGTIGGKYSGGIASITFAKITNCYNIGDITGLESAAGIASIYHATNEISRSYNAGTIVGGGDTGGIAGSVNPTTGNVINITDCYNVSEILLFTEKWKYTAVSAGGIIATALGNVSISNCNNVGDIIVIDTNSSGNKRELYVGGIAGNIVNTNGESISNCYNVGMLDVTVNEGDKIANSSVMVGGIVGSTTKTVNTESEVVTSINGGNITVENNEAVRGLYIGGIVGNGTTISQCGNYGVLENIEKTDNDLVGGVAGNATKISYCYNTREVIGTKDAGGIAATAVIVTQCYNSGKVSGGTGKAVAKATTIEDSYSYAGLGVDGPFVDDADDLLLEIDGKWKLTDIWYTDKTVNDGSPMLQAWRQSNAKIITQPMDIITNEDAIVTFSVEVDADNAYKASYLWSYSDDGFAWTLASETASEYIIRATDESPQFYICEVGFEDGTILASRVAQLTLSKDIKSVHAEVYLEEEGPGTGGYITPGGVFDTTLSDQTFDIVEMPGYYLTEIRTGGMNGAVVDKGVKDGNGVWHYEYTLGNTGNYIWAFFTPLPDVEVKVFLDGSSYGIYDGTISLKQGTETVGSSTTNTNGTYTISVSKSGEYKVFAGGKDTGVTIPAGTYGAEVHFYTVEYSVVDDPIGTSQGSTINSQQVTSGGVVFGGTSMTIEVTAKGSAGRLPTYQYSWTNYASTTNVVVIQNVNSKISTVCTVLGTDGDTSDPTYTITASADPGAFISPSGNITAERGSSKTFSFGALDGYFVSDVIIDGISHPELVNGSSYTFSNVIKNHSIVIKNTRSAIVLNVEILEGKGHVEYNVNGGSFVTYTGEVTLAENSDLVLRAYADEGYNFVRWSGDRTGTEWEISIDDVVSSVYLQVTFETSDSATGDLPDWLWYLIAVLLILLLLLILLAFRRRSYKVIKVESTATIVGKNRAQRNKDYRFEVQGDPAKVSYRVGEEGSWETLVPVDGEYVIPGEFVIDEITIEA